MRKLTIEFVRAAFEKEGYTLLSKEYKNAQQKLDYICNNGHEHRICWGSWQQGKRCFHCSRNVKPTIEFIKKEFAKEGYKLLGKEYKNNKQKLLCVCPEDHENFISWRDFRQGHRCKICGIEKGAAKKRIGFDIIKKSFEDNNYILITKESNYKNNKQKLDYICKNGHQHKICWNSWEAGHRCPYCAGVAKPTIEFIRAEFEKEGYELLTEKYINNEQNLYYICLNNHKYYISWMHWQSGKRCGYCAGNVKLTIEYIRSEFEKEGYELLTTVYKNNKQRLYYICPKLHRHFISWDNWNHKYRCPQCQTMSKGEKKIVKFLEEYDVKYSCQERFDDCRSKNPLPFDFYLKELNILIEYDGEFHYGDVRFVNSIKLAKDCQYRDAIKTKWANGNGIKLIRIPYWKINNIEEILTKKLNLKKEG